MPRFSGSFTNKHLCFPLQLRKIALLCIPYRFNVLLWSDGSWTKDPQFYNIKNHLKLRITGRLLFFP